MNFVQVRYGMKNMLFLLDTGASISVIFLENLQANQTVDKSKQIKIMGIAGSTFSVGSASILFTLDSNDITHEFHIINNFNSDIQGVLGSDFFLSNMVQT